VSLVTSIAQAAPPAFIPPKIKGIILDAPVPEYPMEAANRFTDYFHCFRLFIPSAYWHARSAC